MQCDAHKAELKINDAVQNYNDHHEVVYKCGCVSSFKPLFSTLICNKHGIKVRITATANDGGSIMYSCGCIDKFEWKQTR
jgi:hypothetical protein